MAASGRGRKKKQVKFIMKLPGARFLPDNPGHANLVGVRLQIHFSRNKSTMT